MTSAKEYLSDLERLPREQWAGYLSERSGLPGPRANLTLMQAVADAGSLHEFTTLLDTDDEYLVCCGIVGLGRNSPSMGTLERRCVHTLRIVDGGSVKPWRWLVNDWVMQTKPASA